LRFRDAKIRYFRYLAKKRKRQRHNEQCHESEQGKDPCTYGKMLQRSHIASLNCLSFSPDL